MAGSSEKVARAPPGANVGASNDENGVAAAIETYVLSTAGLPASEMGKIGVEIDEDEANEPAWPMPCRVDDDADDDRKAAAFAKGCGDGDSVGDDTQEAGKGGGQEERG